MDEIGSWDQRYNMETAEMKHSETAYKKERWNGEVIYIQVVTRINLLDSSVYKDLKLNLQIFT